MKIYEAIKNDLPAGRQGFIISTDKSKLNIQFIHQYLCNESYWAKNIPVDTVKKSIDGSFCFGLYVHEHENILTATQVGFARVITDHATFAYVADVFIIDNCRGNGLAKWLMETIMNHPELQGLRRWMLATRDAHTLYAKFGFTALDKPERIMTLKPFETYPEFNA